VIGLLALVIGLSAALPRGWAADSKPHKTGNGDAIKEGRALYLKNGCSGCHGVQGGGGMGVPLLDDVWTFGGDDETLFKLIKGDIPEQTMPRVWKDVLSDDEVWKILAYIRSLYKGDPAKVVW
jgi:cytochrome c(L)